MKENPNIDELLNGFIDGELSQRHQTEVQRLITHDPEIERRLRRLQKCRLLVGSLPRDEAPEGMTEMVKASLERSILLGRHPEAFEDDRGARHLMFRKILSAAAMLMLVATLAAVIYIIVTPNTLTEPQVAAEDWQQPSVETIIEEPAPEAVASAQGPVIEAASSESEFNGRLEVRTAASVAVDAFIKRAIDDNGLDVYSDPAKEGQRAYAVTCTKEGLKSLLADLATIWDRFDSSVLFVDTGMADEQIVVDAVNAQQVAAIAAQDNLERRIEVAKNFAVLNSVVEQLPGEDVLAAADDKSEVPKTIAKPVLTSRQEPAKQQPDETADRQMIHFTIVIEASE